MCKVAQRGRTYDILDLDRSAWLSTDDDKDLRRGAESVERLWKGEACSVLLVTAKGPHRGEYAFLLLARQVVECHDNLCRKVGDGLVVSMLLGSIPQSFHVESFLLSSQDTASRVIAAFLIAVTGAYPPATRIVTASQAYLSMKAQLSLTQPLRPHEAPHWFSIHAP